MDDLTGRKLSDSEISEALKQLPGWQHNNGGLTAQDIQLAREIESPENPAS